MNLEQFHLIKRLPSRTRAPPARNFLICLRRSTFEGVPGLDNGSLLRLPPWQISKYTTEHSNIFHQMHILKYFKLWLGVTT